MASQYGIEWALRGKSPTVDEDQAYYGGMWRSIWQIRTLEMTTGIIFWYCMPFEAPCYRRLIYTVTPAPGFRALVKPLLPPHLYLSARFSCPCKTPTQRSFDKRQNSKTDASVSSVSESLIVPR